jgi:hypothetical protein
MGEIEADLARGEGEPSFGIAEMVHGSTPVESLRLGPDGLAEARHVSEMMPAVEREASRFEGLAGGPAICHQDVTGGRLTPVSPGGMLARVVGRGNDWRR